MPESGETDSELYNQLNEGQLKKLHSFRALLRRYVFVQAPQREIQRLLTDSENQQQYRTLWYYRDRQRRPVTVGNAEMQLFVQACQDQNCMFEVWPATPDLKQNQRVLLHATAFRDAYAYVLEVKPRGNDVDLTVGLPSITDDTMITLRHLRLKDVSVVERAETVPQAKAHSYRFVENTQRQVVGLLTRRAEGPVDEQTAARDADVMSQLAANRHKAFASPFLQAKFTALMLMLTLVSGSQEEREQLVGRAATAVAELRQRQQYAKLTAETIAYVQAALFLTTSQQHHYDEAMAYYNSLPHHSGVQQSLIKLMRQHYKCIRA